MTMTTTEELMAGVDPGFQRVQTSVFKIADFAGEYARLVQGLVAGQQGRTDEATLMEHLDNALDNARRAHKLYCRAVQIHESFELDAKEVEGGWRSEALAALQAEKTAGVRSKSITNDDTEAQIAVMFRTQWKALRMSRLEIEQTEEHCKVLAKLWGERPGNLQSLLARVRMHDH
jgi:hypothetical protein